MNEDKIVLTVSSDDANYQEYIINEPFTEITSYRSGFTVLHVNKIVVSIKKNEYAFELFSSRTLQIFLYKDEELVAKDFIFDFFDKGKKELYLIQKINNGRELPWFTFELKEIE